MLKDLLKEGGIYTIANLLTKGISLLLIPFYTAYFSPSDYGIIDILVVFGAFFNAIISLQISQGLGRFVGDNDIGHEQKIRFASTAIYFTIYIYIIFGFRAYFMSDTIIGWLSSDVLIKDEIFFLALLSIMINGLFYSLGVYFRFLRKTKTFSILAFIHAIGNILFTLILVLGLDYGIAGIFIASIAITPVLITVQFYLLRNHLKWWFVGKSELKQLLRFSVPLVPAAMAYALLNFTDRLFINDYLASNEVGVYGIGAKFASVVGLILAGFSMALNPIIYQKHKEVNSKKELSKIFNLFIFVGSIGVLILSLFSHETLIVFTREEYYGAQVVMPVLYSTVFLTGIWMFSPGLNLYKKTTVIAIVVVFSSLLNIGLNYFLIEDYGLLGTAIATLISTAVNNFILFYWANKYYKVKVSGNKVMIVMFIFPILLYLGSYFIYNYDLSILTIFLSKIGLIIIYIIILLKLKIIDSIDYLSKFRKLLKHEK